MIKIKCTQLEEVRRNPVLYAEILAAGDAKIGGGSHGMFACIKDTTRNVHAGEMSINEGIKSLQEKFIRFDDNVKNKDRQNKLIDKYVKYHEDFKKLKLEFVDGMRLMKWDIHTNVMLTGQTPWIVKNDSGFFSYFLTENYNDNWQSELRYPLLQQYLAENKIKCDTADLQIGIYNFAKGAFEFKNYSKKYLNTSFTETSTLFQNVNDEYEKRKK